MKLAKTIITAITLASLLLTACSGEDAQKSDKPVIGVSLLTMTNPFFKDMGEAITAEAAKHGYEVTIVAGEFDPARQQNQVADFLVNNVAAILLCPVDSRAIGTSVAEANAKGIPVFTADIACTAKGVDVASHIATDNYAAGRLAAVAMIEALKGSGTVGIIDHPEVESVIMRTRGFEDELNEQRSKNAVRIEIAAKLPGKGSKDISFKAAEDMLQANQNLNGIFAINDPSALGAVAAIEKAGKAGKIQVVGIDGMPEGRQAIKDGKVYADVIQHPRMIGEVAVQTIMKYMAGEKVEPEILIKTDIYRRADAENDASLAQ